jgi:hypothetical protein
MADEQLELAIEQLSERNGAGPPEEAVHETRKALKRLRAMLRLLESTLGREALAAETAALREVASELSGARDAEVMLATLDALLERHPRRLDRAGVHRLRGWLVAERERTRRASVGDPVRVALAIADLNTCKLRVQRWQLPAGDELALLGPGLHRLYGQGRRRRRHARTRRGERRRTRAMHEWRKRVKDLRYVAEMLQRCQPPGPLGLTLPDTVPWTTASRCKSSSKPLRQLARSADQLGELLGEDHDLAVLGELVDGRPLGSDGGAPPKLGRRTRKAMRRAIAKRRRRLGRRAFKDGKRLYGQKTKRFVRRTQKTYARAAASSAP